MTLKEAYDFLADLEAAFDKQLYNTRMKQAKSGSLPSDYEYHIIITEGQWSNFNRARALLERDKELATQQLESLWGDTP